MSFGQSAISHPIAHPKREGADNWGWGGGANIRFCPKKLHAIENILAVLGGRGNERSGAPLDPPLLATTYLLS